MEKYYRNIETASCLIGKSLYKLGKVSGMREVLPSLEKAMQLLETIPTPEAAAQAEKEEMKHLRRLVAAGEKSLSFTRKHIEYLKR